MCVNREIMEKHGSHPSNVVRQACTMLASKDNGGNCVGKASMAKHLIQSKGNVPYSLDQIKAFFPTSHIGFKYTSQPQYTAHLFFFFITYSFFLKKREHPSSTFFQKKSPFCQEKESCINLYMSLIWNRIFEQKDSIEQHQLHRFLKVKKKHHILS